MCMVFNENMMGVLCRNVLDDVLMCFGRHSCARGSHWQCGLKDVNNGGRAV